MMQSTDQLLVFQSPGGNIRILAAPSVQAIKTLLWRRELAGPVAYCASRGERLYVGGARCSGAKRIAQHPWKSLGGPPDAIIVFTSDTGFDGRQALCLERIIHAALDHAELPVTNDKLPHGALIDPAEFRHMVTAWSEAVPLLTVIASTIAQPWYGPACLIDSGVDQGASRRLVAHAGRARACIREIDDGGGWLLEPGSILRTDAAPHSGIRAALITQMELAACGALIDRGDGTATLTREIWCATRSAAMRLACLQRCALAKWLTMSDASRNAWRSRKPGRASVPMDRGATAP